LGHLVSFWAPFGRLGAPKMCHFVFVLLRGKAGEFQRDVLLTFVFQRGSITATWRAHRSPVGASCRFVLAFWEAEELQQSF